MINRFIAILFLCMGSAAAVADGPKDNATDNVRPVPPPGVKIAEADRAALTAEVEALGNEIASLREALKTDAKLLPRLPDVQIYYNAVKYALDYNEFYSPKEVAAAHDLLKQGHERAEQLKAGTAPWTTQTGLVVRGYVSKIDESVQPYGLEIPRDFDFDPAKKHRLDFWFHGRGETLTELSFISQRSKSPGAFHPPDAIVVHPYGRYCNANHFAGEVDTWEIFAEMKANYSIDENRVVARGFSMGGAACWNYTVHMPYKFAASAPGAGFSETPEFLRVFQSEIITPTDYEKKLLHMYDCTDWVENLYCLPVVAYSGEIDTQKQAADIMAVAMKKVGLDLVHIIGPGTKHAYEPKAKIEVERLVDEAVAKGRDPMPKTIHFTTYTLHYYRMFWIIVDGMEEHWNRAHVDAEMDLANKTIHITTENIYRVSLAFDESPLPKGETFKVIIDGVELQSEPSKKRDEKTLDGWFIKKDGAWTTTTWWKDNTVLRKRRYLCGPIDDAFMSRFIMVEPTGTPMNEKVGKWTAAEMQHFDEQWRLQFRGIPMHKKDVDITAKDCQYSHLILWGDPSSNKVIKDIAAKLPIQWSAAGIKVGDKTFSAEDHVPVLVYPNPLDHRKYVVINSGFTFREYDYLNNARQVPKLPDWAIMDITQPRTPRQAAGVVDADFFDEGWQLKKK